MARKLIGKTIVAAVTASMMAVAGLAVAPAASADNVTIESALLARINEGRQAAGKAPVVVHSGLRAKQRVHAQNMSASGALTHDGAATRRATAAPDPAEANGAPDDGFSGWCENIAYRTRSGQSDAQVAAGLYGQWFNSTSGHKECMLDTNRAHNVAGLGVFEGSDGRIWAALMLEQDASKPSSGTVVGASSSTGFESPALGTSNKRVVNPYDAGSVTFTAETPSFSDEVVGVVKNTAAGTSACAEPAGSNQKLGTGRSSLSNSTGLAGFPIRARFDSPLIGSKVSVGADVQALAGVRVQIRLFNPAGSQVAMAERVVPTGGGTCGNPGGQRGRVRLIAETSSAVASALIQTASGGYVFVIDNFEHGFVG